MRRPVLETRLLARTEQNDLHADYVEALVAPAVARIIGASVPPSAWADAPTESTEEGYRGLTIDAALRRLRNVTDAFRSRAERELLGAEQLRWIREQTEGAPSLWQLYGQQTVMMEYMSGNVSAAFEELDGRPEYAAWREQFEALLDPRRVDDGLTLRVVDAGGGTAERPATLADSAVARFHYAIGQIGINSNVRSAARARAGGGPGRECARPRGSFDGRR